MNLRTSARRVASFAGRWLGVLAGLVVVSSCYLILPEFAPRNPCDPEHCGTGVCEPEWSEDRFACDADCPSPAWWRVYAVPTGGSDDPVSAMVADDGSAEGAIVLLQRSKRAWLLATDPNGARPVVYDLTDVEAPPRPAAIASSGGSAVVLARDRLGNAVVTTWSASPVGLRPAWTPRESGQLSGFLRSEDEGGAACQRSVDLRLFSPGASTHGALLIVTPGPTSGGFRVACRAPTGGAGSPWTAREYLPPPGGDDEGVLVVEGVRIVPLGGADALLVAYGRQAPAGGTTRVLAFQWPSDCATQDAAGLEPVLSFELAGEVDALCATPLTRPGRGPSSVLLALGREGGEVAVIELAPGDDGFWRRWGLQLVDPAGSSVVGCRQDPFDPTRAVLALRDESEVWVLDVMTTSDSSGLRLSEATALSFGGEVSPTLRVTAQGSRWILGAPGLESPSRVGDAPVDSVQVVALGADSELPECSVEGLGSRSLSTTELAFLADWPRGAWNEEDVNVEFQELSSVEALEFGAVAYESLCPAMSNEVHHDPQ